MRADSARCREDHRLRVVGLSILVSELPFPVLAHDRLKVVGRVAPLVAVSPISDFQDDAVTAGAVLEVVRRSARQGATW